MNRINQIMSKAFLLIFLMIFTFGTGNAATYYISNSGNDSNTGLTTAQAWKSLAKVNSTTFKPGDQILFQRGSTFYGSLTVKNSGTAANPITYGAYGTGNNPVITGFTAVTSWKNLGKNIWESTDAVSTLGTCNMVVMNGVNTPMGRYPNTDAANGGYLAFQSHSGTTSITSSGLSGMTNWTGAQVVVRPNRWTIKNSSIISQSGGTLTFDDLGATPIDSYGFFIQNDIRTLDKQNEWFYNPVTKKLRIYSTSQPINVKVTAVDTIVQISGSYITIDGINIQGVNTYGIYSWKSWVTPSHHLIVKNCNVAWSGGHGIYVKGNYITIQNNTVSHVNKSAINADKTGGVVTISGNVVSDTFEFPSFDSPPGAVSANYQVKSIHVSNNKVLNSGHNAFSLSADSTMIIDYNFADTFNSIIDDGGGLYLGGNNTFGITIFYNILINGIGNGYGTPDPSSEGSRGIYLDDNCGNMEVAYNTVANCSTHGIFVHNSFNCNIHHNTAYNNNVAQLFLKDDDISAVSVENNNIHDNVFVSKGSSQYALYAATYYDNILSFGTFNNNYYARPIDQDLVVKTQQNESSGSIVERTLSGWKTYSRQDAKSEKSPVIISTVNDIRFEYNESKDNKIVTIEHPMVDVKGTKYYGKHTLKPYTSVVLLKVAQTPLTNTEYKTICEGTSYNGWTTSGQYELKTVDSEGNFSLTIVHLTVVPVSKVTESVTINEGENYRGWNQTGSYTRKLTAVSGCDSLVTTKLVVVKLINKQGEVLPTHYSPAGSNQTGQSPMVLRIEGAQLENLPLSNGDEIAVFSGSNCVGAIRLSQAIQLGDPSSYATLSVYPRTATTEGFVANDTIVFKLWSAQLQKEMPINEVAYKNTLESWMTTGKFSSGSASVVELFSYTELNQTINLKEGYNLISAYVLPTNADAGSVLKSLTLSGSLTKVQDESGRAYENWGTAGGWVNSIGLMEATEGYKIRVAADCTLKITGRPVALPLDIPLVEGWNLIAYPRMDEVNAMSVIQSLIDENKLIKVQDEDGSAIENWQAFGGWVNGIGNFVPGKAYKVKVSASTVLHINDTYLKAAVVLAQSAQSEHFFSITEGNGTDHMNINLSGLNGSELQVGDELGAFDGSVCVGSLKVTQGHLDSGLAVITASYKTDASVKDGFTEGNSIQLRIWKQQTGAEVSANLVCNAGRLVYERNASVFVQLKSVALTTSVNTLSNSSEVMVYPNPSDGAFTVKFDQMPDEGSRIDILDLSGRKITSRLVSGYAEDFNLAGQAPGVYLVKSTQGSKEVVRKLIIN